MSKRTRRDDIARIILFECSIFNSDAEIKANMDHPHVEKAYCAADRIIALVPVVKAGSATELKAFAKQS